jgi:hypothetical protein
MAEKHLNLIYRKKVDCKASLSLKHYYPATRRNTFCIRDVLKLFSPVDTNLKHSSFVMPFLYVASQCP